VSGDIAAFLHRIPTLAGEMRGDDRDALVAFAATARRFVKTYAPAAAGNARVRAHAALVFAARAFGLVGDDGAEQFVMDMLNDYTGRAHG